jgi:hypothetical protein
MLSEVSKMIFSASDYSSRVESDRQIIRVLLLNSRASELFRQFFFILTSLEICYISLSRGPKSDLGYAAVRSTVITNADNVSGLWMRWDSRGFYWG